MDVKLFYATGDDFKWRERSNLAEKFDFKLNKGEKINLGRRIEMIDTIEEAVILKWKLASKVNKGWVMVDMNDVLITGRKSWYQSRKESLIDQSEYVNQLWSTDLKNKADLMKVGLKNVLVVGQNGLNPMIFESMIDGIVMYRPVQKAFEKIPAIVPFVYVSIWQEMLDRVYQEDWEVRISSKVTHDAKNMIQALNRIY